MTDDTTQDRHALVIRAEQPENGALNVFGNVVHFEVAQRMARALSSSNIVPQVYQGPENMGNCLIAMEVANRTGSSVLAVMQNLHIIQGRPSWSASYIIAALNSCGRFRPLRFIMDGNGDAAGCHIVTIDRITGDELVGPAVTIKMAKDEGWYGRSGSKWKTMPDLMLRYRAASFFGRLYAPDVLMGMHSREEIEDAPEMVEINPPPVIPPKPAQPDPTVQEPDEPGEAAEPATRKRRTKAQIAADAAAAAGENAAERAGEAQSETGAEEPPPPEISPPQQDGDQGAEPESGRDAVDVPLTKPDIF